MGTLKQAAAAHGIVLGAGTVDPSVPTYPPSWLLVTAPGGTGGPPGGYSWTFPTELNAVTNQPASIIVNEFGGAIDLCLWAKGPIDLSHYGKFGRWLGPLTSPASEAYRPGEYDFRGVDEAYAWAQANGMRCWISDPAYSGIPDWVATFEPDNGDEGDHFAFNFTPAQATTILHDWYTATYSRYPNLYGTTLLNELSTGFLSLANTLGWYQNTSIGAPGGFTLQQWCATICGWVRAANPNVKIVVNDSGMEWDLSKAATFRDWINGIKALGADIGGVGLQSHSFTKKTQAQWDTYRQVLQLFDAAGLEPHVTEFDCNKTGTEQDLYNDYYWGVRAIVESGVVETLNFWTIKDPLFFGANGEGPPPPGIGAPYTPTSGVFYGDVTHLTPTISRQAIEDALKPPPGPHTVRLEAGGTPVTVELVPGAEVSGATATATGGPITRSAVRSVSGATATATGSTAFTAVVPVSGAQAAASAGTIEILSADMGHRIRLVAGGAPVYADLVPGVDLSGSEATSAAGAVAIGAQLPVSGAQATATGSVGLGLVVSGAQATSSTGGIGFSALVPVSGAQATASTGRIAITDNTSLPPPATLHNPVLGTLPHPWWRRHGRAW